jgi:cation transport ATPase
VAMDMAVGMRFSTPIAILAAQTYAARNGILIRSGRAMEMLAQVDTILFDLDDDAGSVAEALSARLGIYCERVGPDLLPAQKLDLVKELQAAGERVALVGDGLNDAAAMAQADVAISLAEASAPAREIAGVLLMSGDLRDLIPAVQIARHALRLIRQNQALVVASAAGTITYATFAVLNPVAGVLLNNGVAFLAAFNSLRSPVGLDRPGRKEGAGTAPDHHPER